LYIALKFDEYEEYLFSASEIICSDCTTRFFRLSCLPESIELLKSLTAFSDSNIAFSLLILKSENIHQQQIGCA
jgi:hypothetical protein